MSEHRWIRDARDPDPGSPGLICEKCGTLNYITSDGRPSVWLMIFTEKQDCDEVLVQKVLKG